MMHSITTAARSAEVLALDVEDLDLPNRRAKVRRKGGAADVIVWQTGTARLLPRLLKGRKSGLVFITERKARVQLPAADLDERGHARLSYQQAAALFSAASGGATLYHLRHSALTHDAEDGHRDADADGTLRPYVRAVASQVRAGVGRGARPAPC
jgi:integrase